MIRSEICRPSASASTPSGFEVVAFVRPERMPFGSSTDAAERVALCALGVSRFSPQTRSVGTTPGKPDDGVVVESGDREAGRAPLTRPTAPRPAYPSDDLATSMGVQRSRRKKGS